MYGLWLRSMLTLKPAQRGQFGPKDGIYASAPWYGMLKDILQVKVRFTSLYLTPSRYLAKGNLRNLYDGDGVDVCRG